MRALRSHLASAAGLALVCDLALACGRYGPPVRPVAAEDAHADSERFEGPLDENYAASRDEAVPYILEGLINEEPPLKDSAGSESDEPGKPDEENATEKNPDGEGNSPRE
jgi:hypothetical protein